jgi:hypothetical protein
MHDETNRGQGKLGPVGSLAQEAELLPVEFEARYHHHLRPRPGGLPPTTNTECIGLWIVACDGRDILPNEYYLHAKHDGASETTRVSNQSGKWQRLALHLESS